ncbi:MAG: sigma-54-dependent transcriptional regulator [Planctomycetales bacterium]
MSQVLVVDDEPAICWSLRELLVDRGHRVEAVGSVEQAWKQLESFRPDAVVLDVRLPGTDGLAALPEFRKRCPQAPVIVITAFGDLPTAVQALGRGAFDYLIKPFDLEQFAAIIERALATPPAQPFPADSETSGTSLVGRCAAMQTLFRQIALIAPTDFPVLLVGETGTGKEVAARAIHEHSPRAAGSFIAICPAAYNASLIESELFGHVRGAFTGAVEHRQGAFELANHGTLLLDEIADTPLAVQVKLLRVLETQRFCPVGSGTERSTGARLIAATHRNLPEMIAAGTFREDLYHRFRVFTVSIPPLRERRDDLTLLVEHFLHRLPGELQPASISQSFWDELHRREWPGNVRELRNAVDHAVVLARREALVAEHLPDTERLEGTASAPEQQLDQAVARWMHAQLQGDSEPRELHSRLVRQVEATLLHEVLAATQNNQSAAAKLLGVDRATLRSRLRQLEQR